ncbi:MAG: hypothetical protein EZS28_003812 [Streblomastix strix]|uniref:Uncharacterized protein n=1 Tax=Streblomastix strix TaxID=222440 RepID=A0A5J4WZW3_9EUKA|nr:MAG: hypothetical protein EZS28_003812 [Streblomastix strix]
MVQNYDNYSVVCAGGGVKAILDINPSTQDDALLLLKADKTQPIDAYSKNEAEALLDDKLNADKTQLVDVYTKGEAYNLLNIKANSGISYTKGEDDALLLLKANQSTTFTKTEIDYLISQIEVGDVDLSGYMTLVTSQTITANKTINNACRFVSSIDGTAIITGALFDKSGADDTVILLGVGGTKQISEFAGTPTYLSDYYTKIQTYSKTETDNKYVRLEDSIKQTITGRLKYVCPFGQTYDEIQHPVVNTYLTMSEVDSKLSNYINATNNQSINGTKTFNANVNATGFVKTGKHDTSVLLACGSDALISSFGGLTLEYITFTSNVVPPVSITFFYCYRVRPLVILQTQIYMTSGTGNDAASIHVATLAIQAFKTHDGLQELKTIILSIKLRVNAASGYNCAAGISDFAELYAYIKERNPKPLDQLQQLIPIGDQTLQQQVKNNDDIIYGSGSNEEFEPPVLNAITNLDLSSQFERQSFLASSGSDPQLIIYGGRITLTASYATTAQTPTNQHMKIQNLASTKVCVINLNLEQKRLDGRTQEVGRIPDSILFVHGKKPQESIPQDSADAYKY